MTAILIACVKRKHVCTLNREGGGGGGSTESREREGRKPHFQRCAHN